MTHVFREESRLEGVDYTEWLKNPTPVKARCDGVRGVALWPSLVTAACVLCVPSLVTAACVLCVLCPRFLSRLTAGAVGDAASQKVSPLSNLLS